MGGSGISIAPLLTERSVYQLKFRLTFMKFSLILFDLIKWMIKKIVNFMEKANSYTSIYNNHTITPTEIYLTLEKKVTVPLLI